MEGAVWMGKKLSNEIEKVCQSYEYLLLEYQQRVATQFKEEAQDSQFSLAAGGGNHHNLNSASQWLIEAVK